MIQSGFFGSFVYRDVQLAMADGIPDVYKTDNGLFVVTEQQNRVQMQEQHPLNLVIPKLNRNFIKNG